MLYSAIAGLYFWAEAQKEAFANNDPCGTITDWSAQGNSVTQASAGAKPTFKTGEVNGLPAFSFDGGDYLVKTGATGIGSGAFTFFAIVKRTGTGSRRTIWYAGDSTNAGRQLVIDSSEKLRITKSQIAEVAAASASVSTSAYELWCVTYDGSTYTFYRNGVLDSTGAASQTFTDTVPIIMLGTNTGSLPSEPFNSKFALALAYDSVLSSADRIKVENQVAADYALFATIYVPTFYMVDQYAPGSKHLVLQPGGVPPATATTPTRWSVGTTASHNHARMLARNLANFGHLAFPVFSTTPQPFGPLQTTPMGDSYRTGRYRGTLAAGTWYFSFPVIAVADGGSQDGRIRLRIWKSVNPSGAGATELTSGVVSLAAVTNLTTGAAQISDGSVSMPAITLHSEYLFVQVSWQIDGAGGSSSADVALCVGADAYISTPTLDPSLMQEIPGFYAVYYTTANFLLPDEADAELLTSRFMGYSSRRGRADALSGIQAGSLSVLLDDDDGELDPENTSSTLYPNVKLKRGIQVVAQYGGITYPRGTGAINRIAPNPLPMGANVEIDGLDLYNRLLNVDVTDTFPAQTDGARISALLTTQGLYALGTSDGAFSPPAASLVKASLLQHIDSLVKAGRGQFWIGPDGLPYYWGRHERLHQTSIGTFGAGGDYQIPTPQPVLDDAGLYNQVSVRRSASGSNEVQRITITGSPSDGAFVLAYEGAATYAIGHDSDIVFIQTALEALSTIGAGNVQVSSHSAGLPDIPVDVTFVGDLALRPLNPMVIGSQTWVGGTSPNVSISTVTHGVDPTQTANDSASQADYGVIPFTLDQVTADLLGSDAEALYWAQWLTYQQSQPTNHFRVIEINPWADPANLWPILLSADIGQVLTITHDLPGTKGLVGETYYIEGIEDANVDLAGDPLITFRFMVSKTEADFGNFWIVGVTDTIGPDLVVGF